MSFEFPSSESPSTPLADALDARRQELIHRWTDRLRQGLAPRARTQSELEDSIEDYLQQLTAVLRHPQRSEAIARAQSGVARLHGSQRLSLGFDVTVLVREYDVLRECILDLVEETGVPVTLSEVRALSAFITTSIAEAVDEYTRQRDALQRLNEVRLQALLDQAPAAIYAKDSQGRYFISNRYLQEILGYSREDLLGRDDHALFPEALAEALRNNDAQALTGHTCSFEEVVEHPSGPRTYLSVKFPLPGAEGFPAALGGISTDITERQRSEAERVRLLREAESARAELANIFQQVPAAICVLKGPEHRVTLANPRYRQLVGGQDLEGKPLREVFPSLEDQGLLASLDRAYRTGEPFESREVPVREGRFLDFIYQPTRTPDGQLDGIFVHAVDVTEQVRARHEAEALTARVRRSEERLRQATSAADVGTWSVDLRTEEATQDASLNRILGLPEEATHRSPADLLTRVHPDDRERLEAEMRRARQERNVPSYEYRIVRPDGQVRWLRDKGAVLLDEDGSPRVMLGAAVDITPEKNAEAELAEILDREQRAREQAEETLVLLDTLFTTAPVGQSFLDRELRFVRINQMLADIHGVPLERTLGRTFREVLPELADRVEPIYRHVLETGQAVLQQEVTGTTPARGAEVRHWLISHFPVRNPAGEIFLVGTVVLDITDRKRAEEALRESEERFRLLVDGVEDYAIFMLDPDGRVASWNPGAERIQGWKAEDVLGQSFTVFHPPEEMTAGTAGESLRVAATEGRYQTQGPRVRKDGSRFWADVLLTALHDERGTLRGFAKITRDISAQRAAEEALRETTQRLQAILETAVDSIITIDERGRIQSLNPATVRLFGYSPEELIGQNISRLMPQPYRREHDGYMRNYLETGVRKVIGIGREVQGRRKDGSVFPMELAVSEVRLPQGRFFTGIVRDITARKRAEQAQSLFVEAGTLLSQSLDTTTTLKSLASLVVSRLADYCMVDLLGEDGQLHRFEVAAREPERQALLERGKAYPPVLESDSPLARALEGGHAVALPDITPGMLKATAHDAEHLALLEALAPRSSVLVPLVARGRKLGLLTIGWVRSRAASLPADLEVARGVADRAAMAIDNARLYQEAQEAIRVREDVVAIVSHDLRNPLNAIGLSATLLLKREDVDQRTTRTASRILSSADRASRMIRDLLDFTQARVGGIPIHPTPLDFHQHVRRLVEEVQLTHPERHLEHHASGNGRGEWDGDRLAQVVTNLVGNAVQHSPEGTLVRVSTRGEASDVVLEVHNEGPSIPEELLPTLFEPYHRGPEAGSGRGSLGLGLFISRQLVLGHGGTLEVHSIEGDGTTFTVRLPRRRP